MQGSTPAVSLVVQNRSGVMLTVSAVHAAALVVAVRMAQRRCRQQCASRGRAARALSQAPPA